MAKKGTAGEEIKTIYILPGKGSEISNSIKSENENNGSTSSSGPSAQEEKFQRIFSGVTSNE